MAENQIDKNLDHEMGTGVRWCFSGVVGGEKPKLASSSGESVI